jgi:hypothetical protein
MKVLRYADTFIANLSGDCRAERCWYFILSNVI